MAHRQVRAAAVLRRRADYVVGWIGLGVGAAVEIGVILGTTGISFAVALQFAAIASLILWFVWVVMHAHVVVADRGITVVNWYVRCDIPWEMIKEVSCRVEVEVILRDGRTIKPVIGSYSLVSAIRGSDVQKLIAEAIEGASAGHRAEPADDPGHVRWRPDLHLLVLSASLIGIDALIYALRG